MLKINGYVVAIAALTVSSIANSLVDGKHDREIDRLENRVYAVVIPDSEASTCILDQPQVDMRDTLVFGWLDEGRELGDSGIRVSQDCLNSLIRRTTEEGG